MTDGPVYAMTHIGSTVFLGGRFSQVRQKPLKQGGPFVNVDDLAGVDATTGAPVEPTWDPSFNLTGTVYALAPSPDGSMIYVGGDFSGVASAPSPDPTVVNSYRKQPGLAIYPACPSSAAC